VAARDYLVSLGVDGSRLNTVSYGKERPVALGSDEESWAKNRRAVTVTID
jgi:peptidoglycan-associated lipoprotein